MKNLNSKKMGGNISVLKQGYKWVINRAIVIFM